MLDAKKEADLTLKEAKVQAQKILNDAEFSAKNIFLKLSQYSTCFSLTAIKLTCTGALHFPSFTVQEPVRNGSS